MTEATIRAGLDDDAAGFIALLGACWAEYPGMVLDVDAEVPEFRALATDVASKGGTVWAAEAEGRVVGMIAAYPEAPWVWTIARMYVDRAHRGTGLADRLLETAEARARADGATGLTLWTDTRFTRSHRFYERHGYVRVGPTRSKDDLSRSVEFDYVKPVGRPL